MHHSLFKTPAVTLISTALIMTLPGCASLGHAMKSNTFIGASLGATVGATSGAVIGSPKNAIPGTFIGLASGALLGGLIGWITEPHSEKKLEATPAGIISTDPDSPKLTAPVVRKVWQDDKIDDGKFIQGHYIWVLERGSVWSMP